MRNIEDTFGELRALVPFLSWLFLLLEFADPFALLKLSFVGMAHGYFSKLFPHVLEGIVQSQQHEGKAGRIWFASSTEQAAEKAYGWMQGRSFGQHELSGTTTGICFRVAVGQCSFVFTRCSPFLPCRWWSFVIHKTVHPGRWWHLGTRALQTRWRNQQAWRSRKGCYCQKLLCTFNHDKTLSDSSSMLEGKNDATAMSVAKLEEKIPCGLQFVSAFFIRFFHFFNHGLTRFEGVLYLLQMDSMSYAIEVELCRTKSWTAYKGRRCHLNHFGAGNGKPINKKAWNY